MADFSEIKSDSKSRMDKTIETLRGDFGSLRAGRAHVSLLDGIMVEAYGSMTPLSQVGTVSVPDPRTLSISIWDRSLAKAVDKALRESDLGLNLRRIDAREEFLTALAGVSDPAEKERIVTERLMSILSREAAAIDDIRLVIQGTNVTDTLYRPHTGSTIDGLPIIEPVRELFKDEIRQVGQELGMPAVLVNRQPFPGSGLASRIMADVTAERLDILREADDIFRHDVEDSNQNKRLWQYFAALALSPFPDGGYVVTLRAVQTAEGAAGNTARFTADLLERVTAHILAQCPKVQRVFYDLTPSKSYKRANL